LWLELTSVAGMSVRVVARWMGPEDCPPRYVANEFGSLGTLQTMFVLGTPLGITECGS